MAGLAGGGFHDLTVISDGGEALDEFNETNNARVVSFTYTPPASSTTVPRVAITAPAPGAGLTQTDVDVKFAATNWVVGGKGSAHIHFRLDGGSDHFMFYNGSDNVVEFNTAPGRTPKATWVDAGTIRFHGLTAGQHTVRTTLATAAHQLAGNPEADASVTFTVNAPAPAAGGAASGYGLTLSQTSVAPRGPLTVAW
ncbi:MAG: hypothetical protein FD129_3140, partial [bacterium]